MSFSSHFSFFVLVDEVNKNENRLCDFLYDVFHLQGKTGKTKMKSDRKYFCLSTKTKTKNGMKSSKVF